MRLAGDRESIEGGRIWFYSKTSGLGIALRYDMRL